MRYLNPTARKAKNVAPLAAGTTVRVCDYTAAWYETVRRITGTITQVDATTGKIKVRWSNGLTGTYGTWAIEAA